MGRVPTPRFLIGLALFTAGAASALAAPIEIDRRIEGSNGASLVVKTIDLRADSIALSVAVANPGDREISLNRGRSLVVEDAAHGVHRLNPPADNPELRIPMQAQLSGELVFIGPLAPSARQLSLSGNGFDATIALPQQSGTAAARQADHPDGTALRIQGILATGPACLLSLLATNGSDRTIVLNQNRSLALTDRHGVAAPFKAPAENRELVVPSGDRLDARLAFDCRAIDASGPLTLTTNRPGRGTAGSPDDAAPVFIFKIVPERRAEPGPPAGSRAAVAPIAWSRLSASPETGEVAPQAAQQPGRPARQGAVGRTGNEAASGAGPADSAGPDVAVPRRAARIEAGLGARRTERGLRLALAADTLFGAASMALAGKGEQRLGQLAELIAQTHMREVIVTVHAGAGGANADVQALARQRARAVVAWLERHAARPRPHFVAKAVAGADAPDPGRERDWWVDVILRRDYLVPNRRSPASPSPGKI
jgi:outer membrane protein OmpA-like peptidoglycan-associated protein